MATITGNSVDFRGFPGWTCCRRTAVLCSGRTRGQLAPSSPAEGHLQPLHLCPHWGGSGSLVEGLWLCSGEVAGTAVGVLGPSFPSSSQASRFPEPALLGTASLSGQLCSPLVSMATKLPGRDGEVLQDQHGRCGPLPHRVCCPGLSLARSSLLTLFFPLFFVEHRAGAPFFSCTPWCIANLLSRPSLVS